MAKKQVRQMAAELYQKLSDRRFLQQTGITKKHIQSLFVKEEWERWFDRLLPIKERVTCREIFERCEKVMNRLSPEPEEGWMKFTYQFACRLLYPDDAFAAVDSRHKAGCLFYLAVMQFVYDEERKTVPFDPLVDFQFLEDEESRTFEHGAEYRKFRQIFRQEYVYEMMRLNGEVTTFRTLEHIAGVHHVALTIARGLYGAGVPIDVTLASGAAAGHDLGKFGCKPNERVPYLHYYYTDKWFTRHNMQYIGHIAANHSTWDLEPENLSAESLTLIYADFRVKQSRGNDGATMVSTLDEAFQVILDKLDNVDDTKLRRYRFVYARLHDFEDYMKSLGVDTELSGRPGRPVSMPDIALRDAGQVVQSLVFLGVRHNIDVMNQLGEERRFGNMLEAARSEKNWKNVRAYMNIIQEYFTYTNDLQKIQTLSFLYELLMHREGDIRRKAAEMMGSIIARFNAGYKKERPADMPDVAEQKVLALWEDYLKKIICPDHKLTTQQKTRIAYTLKLALSGVLRDSSPADRKGFLKSYLNWMEKPGTLDEISAFAILDAIHYVPFELLTDEEMEMLGRFVAYYFQSPEHELFIAAGRAFKLFTAYTQTHPYCGEIERLVKEMNAGDDITLVFLQYRVLTNLGCDTTAQQAVLYGRDVVSDIFLDNLKASTPWVIKAVNIKLLVDQVDHGIYDHILHIAAHFSNLIKVSERVAVRHEAGRALLKLIKLLKPDQRNEIAIELVKGLEVGEYEFSKYIPTYLGEVALWLPPEQLDEVIAHLKAMLASGNDRIVSVALDTIGILVECYPAYPERFPEPEGAAERRNQRLLGMLLSGLANHRQTVRQEALLVIGQTVFGSARLGMEHKSRIFGLCFKKFLFLINEYKEDELTGFYRASALSHISRFITAYRLTVGEVVTETRNKVAFFPGTFDPFTLSHKGIVQAIRDMGYEVYLAVDEFSWSKKAQPHLIRRQIVSMSVADEFHVHIFPDDIPVNIANPPDLKRLLSVFPGKEVYVVVGTDVVANASSYKAAPAAGSIQSMNHIIFRRAGDRSAASDASRAVIEGITGKVIELELPAHLEDISSTKIRENIDLNRDISNLIDPLVQEFIYHNSLYLREPEYKPIIRARAIAFEYVEHPDDALYEEIRRSVLYADEGGGAVVEAVRKAGDSLYLIRNTTAGGRLVGFAANRYITPQQLYGVLGNIELAALVRQHTHGQILLISGIYVARDPAIDDAEQLLLTETIARSFDYNCAYGLFYPHLGSCSKAALSAIERQGFTLAPGVDRRSPLYIVDMHAPLVLMQNLETTVKEPFSSNPQVLKAIAAAHRELQMTMTKLYPGQLVLSLSAGVIYHRLVDKITALNGVPREPVTPRTLGEYMCVPFGKILRGKVVPNTVTKTLHTDKVYEPDLRSSVIEQFPYYSPLKSQVRAIKSFGRPIILVDDLLHGGGRLEALEPLFKEEGVTVGKVLLGMISGYGRDKVANMGLSAESVYSIPNLRHWFVESTLYPFIGGDTVRRDTMKVAGLMPSINMILPYTTPPLEGCTREALFEFSACCIRNARNILMTLESEYRAHFARNLTLSRLSEAVILPLCPDKGECVNYDPNLAASVYLENDLQMLYRTWQMLVQ